MRHRITWLGDTHVPKRTKHVEYTAPEGSKQCNEWVGRLTTNSDTEVAVIVASYVDAALEALLRNFLIDDQNEADELLGADRPIGSFGARIRTAYVLGLITRQERDDLKRIKDIRNEFAHSFEGRDFTQQPIRSWCENIVMGRDTLEGVTVKNPLRARFQVAGYFLGGVLAGRVVEVKKERRAIMATPTRSGDA